MTWFGGFWCYYSSWTCWLTVEAWGWGRSSRSSYESWSKTTLVRACSSEMGGETAHWGLGRRGTVQVTERGGKKKSRGIWSQSNWGVKMCPHPGPPKGILLLLCWKFLSFDSWIWSAVTAVCREGCVLLTVAECVKKVHVDPLVFSRSQFVLVSVPRVQWWWWWWSDRKSII